MKQKSSGNDTISQVSYTQINNIKGPAMRERYHYEHFSKALSAGYVCTDKAMHNEFHLHNSYEIYFFIQGNVNYFVEQSSYQLQKGNLLIFNNQEIHKAVNLTDTPYERITIHFQPKLIQSLCTDKTDLLACFHNHDVGVNNITLLDTNKSNYFISTALQLIHHLENDTYGSDIMSITYLVHLLIMVNEIFENENPMMKSILSPKIIPILQYIDSHITEDLSLDIISKVMSMDKYYLSHLFKQNTGSTVYQYILAKRIALSKQLLKQGKSVTETCEQSGFNDYSNFIRTFKKATGISPGTFIHQ
jgi:AraC-like DNA-binding protein/quercetin dioxygenase-like cupin family protein